MPALVYEQHCHTPLCRHADGLPEAYAAVAERRGLAGVVVTCHNPMPDSYGHSGRMRASEMGEYLNMIAAAAETFAGRVDVRAGIECDFFPGYESHVEHQLATYHFHHVLGSVHPHLAIWRRHHYVKSNPVQTQVNYFEQLAQAAETKLFDTISHPDLIKNMTADHWNIARIRMAIAEALDRIAATGCAMELNTSGLLKHIAEMNPAPEILAMMNERDIPVVIGADAHVPSRVAAGFEDAYALLLDAGYKNVSYFLERERHEIPIPAAHDSLIPATETADA